MSNILFADNQYEMTGFVTGSNGNHLAQFTSSLTPNVIYAGVLDRQQQDQDLADWVSSLRLSLQQTPNRNAPTPVDPPGGPGGPNPGIQQPNGGGGGDGPVGATTPEPATWILLALGLLLLLFARTIRRATVRAAN